MALDRFARLAVLSLTVAALAGCTTPADDDEPEPPTDDKDDGMMDEDHDEHDDQVVGACDMAVNMVPGTVDAEEAFQVNETLTCPFAWEADHVAAHLATTSTDAPSLQHYDIPCTPIKAAMGDDTVIDCAVMEPGVYYIRGHAIVGSGPGATHVWSDEYLVVVSEPRDPLAGAVEVDLWNLRSTATAGAEYAFPVSVSWAIPPPGVPTDHVGAHWSAMSHADEEPSPTVYENACAHASGTVPGTFTTTCVFAAAGAAYFRGHARFEVSGELANFWTAQVPLTVV